MASRTHAELFASLVGKTVKAIVASEDPKALGPLGFGEQEWGLLFTDGTIAWVDRDPEGNGPGWLAIQAAS